MLRPGVGEAFIRGVQLRFRLMSFKRSHLTADLSSSLAQSSVKLSGWVQNVRKAGKDSCFCLLRDHSGVVQLSASGEVAEKLSEIPVESAISISGSVSLRPERAINPKMRNGDLEVSVKKIEFVNKCVVAPPFRVGDVSVSEDVRLKHRYLDIRSESLQHALRARAEVSHAVRSRLRDLRFVEVETPYLFRPTPEGAKEFLVKTRWPNLWYSLPQSPQQYKQLLMMGGMDRYFQIARCFRDEDMRTERQPEFTQVDLEMAFADEEDVMRTGEEVLAAACEAVQGSNVSATKFRRMFYHDAMRQYGIDKPDLRIPSIIEPLVGIPPDASKYRFYKKLVLSAAPSKDALQTAMTENKFLMSIVQGKQSAASRLFQPSAFPLLDRHADPNRVVLIAGGDDEMELCEALGKLRLHLDKVPEDKLNEKQWLWVTHFPMFEKSSEGWKAAHHPFTAPLANDEHLIRNGGPAAYHARARSYDIVLNGVELGGGSVRIHDVELQLAALRLVGVDKEHAFNSMGHLLNGLAMGAPPHAGMAFGLDRLMMLLLGAPSLKQVIAFPKAADGKELMVGSPAFLKD